MDANVARDLEVRERLLGAPQFENGVGILAGAGEKGGERLSAEAHDGERSGTRHGGRRAKRDRARIRIGPARRLNREIRVIDIDEAERAAVACIGRTRRSARQALALSAEADDNLACDISHHVLAAVTAKRQRRFELGCQVPSGRDADLLQKGQRSLRAVAANERETRSLRRHRALVHGDRLEVAVILAGGLEARRLEAVGNVLGSALVGGGSGVAALHTVVGESFRRMPPRARVDVVNLTVARVLLCVRYEWCRECQCEQQAAFRKDHFGAGSAPVSAMKPTAAIPATAQASSWSEFAPVIPTAPMTPLPLDRI